MSFQPVIEKNFNETLESVLNQTIKPLEIIIVNNGKVNLEDLYKKCFNKVSILLIMQVCHTLNFGASIAKGTYSFEDDDLGRKII